MRERPWKGNTRRPLSRDELTELMDRLADALERGSEAPAALRALAGRIHQDTLMPQDDQS